MHNYVNQTFCQWVEFNDILSETALDIDIVIVVASVKPYSAILTQKLSISVAETFKGKSVIVNTVVLLPVCTVTF